VQGAKSKKQKAKSKKQNAACHLLLAPYLLPHAPPPGFTALGLSQPDRDADSGKQTRGDAESDHHLFVGEPPLLVVGHELSEEFFTAVREWLLQPNIGRWLVAIPIHLVTIGSGGEWSRRFWKKKLLPPTAHCFLRLFFIFFCC
jgi:hypothetical protein